MTTDETVKKLLARRTLALIVGFLGLILGVPLGMFLLSDLPAFLGWTLAVLYFGAAVSSVLAGFVAESRADTLSRSEWSAEAR